MIVVVVSGVSMYSGNKIICVLCQVGHKEGEQFTFHWWDHVFNKASASLQVESHQVSGLKKKNEAMFIQKQIIEI